VAMRTPAAPLTATAIKAGWLRKEGKGNKSFKRRWFVLWTTPKVCQLSGAWQLSGVLPPPSPFSLLPRPRRPRGPSRWLRRGSSSQLQHS
jgi:hypothetical protein